jgi:hypothetical protein
MKSRLAIVTGLLVSAALTSIPAHGRQVSAEDHATHHPGGDTTPKPATPAPAPPVTPAPQAKGMAGMNMVASNAKLDELVTTMNTAQGAAKVDAIAAVLTALVHEHQSMHSKMASMMATMHDGAGRGDGKK